MLIRHTVCRFLEERGFEVEAAIDGRDALRALAQSHAPDLIITDMNMPGMDGREFIAQLKQRPATAVIPVIVLTGRRSGNAPVPEHPPELLIYKDIDIEVQLDRAVSSVAVAR
jgi:CheY-like chemotaxis protein